MVYLKAVGVPDIQHTFDDRWGYTLLHGYLYHEMGLIG